MIELLFEYTKLLKKGVEQNPDAIHKDEFDIILQVMCTRGDWLGKIRMTLKKNFKKMPTCRVQFGKVSFNIKDLTVIAWEQFLVHNLFSI